MGDLTKSTRNLVSTLEKPYQVFAKLVGYIPDATSSPKKVDDSWHKEMVAKANASFLPKKTKVVKKKVARKKPMPQKRG